jgi:hypothetical protein
MHKLLIALAALAVLASGPTAASGQTPASDRNAVMVPIRQFVDGFNKGDTKTALAACAEQASIIDEFPPYEWHGAGACAKWADDYGADAKKNGITDGFVTLDTPKHIDIAANRAYVVVPSNYAFKKDGKPVKEIGSMLTFALERGAAGWRITGWAWAKN